MCLGAVRGSDAQIETDADDEFFIGDLARDFGVTLRTLRFYEARDLIRPRRSGTKRIYSAHDRARLALILKGKQLGFTLMEICGMLANQEVEGALVGGLHLSRSQIVEQLQLLHSQRAEIENAIAELEASQAHVSEARASIPL